MGYGTDWFFRAVASSVEELSLLNNSLANVPLFGNMSKLTSLNLYGNLLEEFPEKKPTKFQLEDVPEKSFEGLSQLRHLRLERNKICSLSPNALSEVKSHLELLDLSGNCLTAIPAQHLRNSVKLMYLDLSDNKIAEINNFELMNLPQLKELRLHNNILNEIHPMAFMNVPQLRYLYMRDNLIGNLEGNRLQAFRKLEILDVTNNLLKKLPELKDLINLKQVRIDGNLIEKIETLAFSNNPKLQLISIQNNNIVQIARNSFDSLDQLLVLLLANNSIQSIERGMLDGMRNLQQLNLRNNSLTSMDENTFSSLRQLTTLDLAHNNLRTIAKRTFAHQTKLFWLDLSNNQLSSFEEGTFETKIANILLDGNRLICDDAFDWFIRYLVTNRVRTFLPFQPEISCAGPEKYAGVRLASCFREITRLKGWTRVKLTSCACKEREDQNTFTYAVKGTLHGFFGLVNLLKDLMMRKANDTLTEGMKTLGLSEHGQRSFISSLIPGFRSAPAAGGGVLEQAANGIPILSTLSQAIPLMRNMPGLDVANPRASAGQLVNPKLNTAIEQFTAPLVRFATGGQPVASDIEQLIQSIPNFVVNVPGLGDVDVSKLDPNLVAHVLKGGQIPGIPKETLDAIVQQYMLKVHEAAAAARSGKPLKDGNKIITALSRGEIPDLRNLPADLTEHFKSNSDKLAIIFNRVLAENTSLEELLAKLPKFEKPVLSTFSPYDINRLSNEMIHEEEEAEKAAKVRLYTAIALGLVGAATIVVLAVFAVYIKRQREGKQRWLLDFYRMRCLYTCSLFLCSMHHLPNFYHCFA
ncbi:unnamed protein product [Angiostrongylus costaricensis]|uniref:TIR domain-containing protein n=1 Tax=Angiostrongylus costaricensis TaxID=334426 RepID=A0A158PKI4_ANGCS|nr:unnamed protein product [Angiostrongylus costaricensis]